MASLVQQLIMNMMGADSLESLKNPAYQALDENGNPMPGYVDPSFKGNPDDAIKKYGTSDPYIKPDVFTRAFKPQIASQVDAQNLLGYNSQIANTAQNQVGATNTKLASSVYGMPYIDAVNTNPAAASRVFPNQTPEGVLSANTAVQSQKLNQPYRSALATSLATTDAIRREDSRLAGNLPELETGADSAKANFTSLTLPSAGQASVVRNYSDLISAPWELSNRIYTDKLNTENAKSQLNAGIPALNASVTSETLKDNLRKEVARWLTHASEKEVKAGNAKSDYEISTLPSSSELAIARNNSGLFLNPSETARELVNNIASTQESKRAIINADTLDKIYGNRLDTALSAGNIENTLTKAKEKSLPLLTQAQHQELLNGIWGLLHPDLPQMPYYRNPSTGMAEKNPSYMNTLQMMNAKLGKDGSTPSGHISVGNGLNILPNNISSTNTTVNPTHASSLLTKADLTPITRQVNVGTEGGSSSNATNNKKDFLDGIIEDSKIVGHDGLGALKWLGPKAGTALQYLEMILKGQSSEDYFQSHKRF